MTGGPCLDLYFIHVESGDEFTQLHMQRDHGRFIVERRCWHLVGDIVVEPEGLIVDDVVVRFIGDYWCVGRSIANCITVNRVLNGMIIGVHYDDNPLAAIARFIRSIDPANLAYDMATAPVPCSRLQKPVNDIHDFVSFYLTLLLLKKALPEIERLSDDAIIPADVRRHEHIGFAVQAIGSFSVPGVAALYVGEYRGEPVLCEYSLGIIEYNAVALARLEEELYRRILHAAVLAAQHMRI